MKSIREAVIVDVLRGPSGSGKPGGALSQVHPVNLLADVLERLVARNGLDPETIDDGSANVSRRPASRA
jgi:acetyl-CoA acyltransferase